MLRDILTDRFAVNVLKILWNNEKNNRIVTKDSEIINSLGKTDYSNSYKILEEARLIVMEKGKDKSITITNKGKRFIQAFDRLREITYKDEETRSIRVVYDLPEGERKILLAIQVLCKKTGSSLINAGEIIEKVYGIEPDKKKSDIDEILTRLEDMDAIKIEDGSLIGLTQHGKKMLQDIVLDKIF